MSLWRREKLSQSERLPAVDTALIMAQCPRQQGGVLGNKRPLVHNKRGVSDTTHSATPTYIIYVWRQHACYHPWGRIVKLHTTSWMLSRNLPLENTKSPAIPALAISCNAHCPRMTTGFATTVLAPSASTLKRAFFCALAAGPKATLSSSARFLAGKEIF